MHLIKIHYLCDMETTGGKRPNSGRPKRGYEVEPLFMRVRPEYIIPLRKLIKEYIAAREKERTS